MQRTTLLILLIMPFCFLACSSRGHAEKRPESYYAAKWCREHNGTLEYVLSDQTRVDCLTDTLAVEFDWASKWAEGLGQALHYSYMTKKKGAVVLLFRDPVKDEKYRIRLINAAACCDIEIYTMQTNGSTEQNK